MEANGSTIPAIAPQAAGADPRVSDLIHTRDFLTAGTLVKDVVDYFKARTNDFVAIVEEGALAGLVGREALLRKVGTQYGWALYAEKPVSKLTERDATVVDGGTRVTDAMKLVVARKAETVFNDLIVSVQGGYAGLISVHRVMLAHMNGLERKLRLVEEQRDAIQRKNRQLVEANMRVLRTGGHRANAIAETSLPICSIEKDGIVSSANERFARVIGCALDDLVGTCGARDIFPTGYEEELQDYLARADDNGDSKTLYPLRLKRKDGTLVWVEVAFEFVHTTGQIILSIADIPDTTQQELQELLDKRYARAGGAGSVLARKAAATMRARGLTEDGLHNKIETLAEYADQIEAVEPASGSHLQGSLREFGPVDLAQLLVHGGKTGVLVLQDEILTARLAFDGGALIHAETTDGAEAISALTKALRITQGSFEFLFHQKPGKNTLEGDAMTLLMEACRAHDESTHDASASGAALFI